MEATSGQATVYGLDVSRSQDINKVRQMTGVCPQYNLHFDELTVEENLRVFAGIKCIEKSNWDNEVCYCLFIPYLPESIIFCVFYLFQSRAIITKC